MRQTAAVKMMVRQLKTQKKGPVRPDGSETLPNLLPLAAGFAGSHRGHTATVLL